MADHSKIEWTDATWNPVTGCSVVSPGCTNCYAMRLAGTRLKHHPSRAGLTRDTKAGPVWTGEVRFNEAWLTQPLQWKRPRMVFVCAHGDLFHEDVPDAWIDQVFAVMALSPQHTFQVLTKRSERMRRYCRDRQTPRRIYDIVCDLAVMHKLDVTLIAPGFAYDAVHAPPGPRVHLGRWPLRNVWKGVSVEDQDRANLRVPELLLTPAAVRFVSAEPLLGAISFGRLPYGEGEMDALKPTPWLEEVERWRGSSPSWEEDFLDWFDLQEMPTGGNMHPVLDWMIVGGENGPRPMLAEWAQSIRDQCAAADVPFFFKQWGTCLPSGQAMADGRIWAPRGGPALRAVKGMTGRLLDGVEYNAMPRTA